MGVNANDDITLRYKSETNVYHHNTNVPLSYDEFKMKSYLRRMLAKRSLGSRAAFGTK